MKIIILARNPNLYSHKRLIEEGEKRGHVVRVLNPLNCYMRISSDEAEIRYRGELIDGVDAVIPRIGASVTFYGTAVVRQFEMMDVYTLNESVAISRSRDKLRALQFLAKKKIKIPHTAFAHFVSDTDDLIRMVGGAPLVVKLLEGTQGLGVMLAHNQQAAESVIKAFRGLKANILAQEFIEESKGCDIRCFVIGDKVVGSMERRAKEGEFRSNLHVGGKGHAVKITKEERILAIAASKAMGLKVSGVDILRSKDGPMVLEVNSSPGLEGIETVTQDNIAGQIIEYIERKVKR